jgi:hypothetical protein
MLHRQAAIVMDDLTSGKDEQEIAIKCLEQEDQMHEMTINHYTHDLYGCDVEHPRLHREVA